MPYAYGAKIEHEFDGAKLNIWLTFRHPMDQNVEPALNLWTLTVDTVDKAISDSDWVDEFTLWLESVATVAYPDRVLLAYDGPSGNLQTTWGKDWEPWGDTLSTDIGRVPVYVHRGDPAALDFEIGDLTKDAAWHELDLSTIVPAGASAVHLGVFVKNTVIERTLQFRHTSQANLVNRAYCKVIVANVSSWYNVVQALDADRKIDYWASAAGWTLLNICVQGWWL